MSSKLLEIQRGYFEIIKKYFGHFYDEAKKNNVNPSNIAEDVLRSSHFSKLIRENIDDTFGNEVENFWLENYEDLLNECKKLSGFRLYYGGDISPVDSNIVNRMGLYADTIIIPDPALRTIGSGIIAQVVLPQKRLFLLLKSAIKMLEYESLVFAQTPQPIVIIFPAEIIMRDKNIQKELSQGIREKTTKFFNENMIINNPDFQSWQTFFKKLKNVAAFKKVVKNKEIFLFDSNIPISDFDKQLAALTEYKNEHIKKEVIDFMGGEAETIFSSIFGRIAQAEWHIAKSEIFSGFPVQDAYVSWNYLKWDMKNSGDISKKSVLPSYLMEEEFLTLGKVPVDVLLKLRENGELQDLRECIEKEITKDIAIEKSEETIKQIQYNLQAELKKHQEEIKKLDDKFIKSLKLNIPSLLTSVSFGILGVVEPWLSVPGVLLGGSSVMDIAKEYDEKSKEKDKFNKSFWGFYANNLDM